MRQLTSRLNIIGGKPSGLLDKLHSSRLIVLTSNTVMQIVANMLSDFASLIEGVTLLSETLADSKYALNVSALSPIYDDEAI